MEQELEFKKSQYRLPDDSDNSKIFTSDDMFTYTQADIVEALKICLKEVSPMIKPTNTLTNMVFFILKSFFIDKKRFVVAECPTGSGKTIIGFMTYFCIQYLEQKAKGLKPAARPEPKNKEPNLCYYITSNKVLQEQIDNDIRRFDFFEYLFMLKGTDNYICYEADKKFRNDPQFKQRILDNNPQATFGSYNYRPCAGKTSEQIQKRFPNCADKCPYKVARGEAAGKSCTIFNYAYFLNVMRNIDDGIPSHFFYRRLLTICDEAHLIPDIVCNFFNYEFNQTLLTRIRKLIEEIIQGFGYREEIGDIDIKIREGLHFFYSPVNRLSEILDYVEKLREVEEIFNKVKKIYSNNSTDGLSFSAMYADRIDTLKEQISNFTERYDLLKNLFITRPEDVYFESEKIIEGGTGYGIEVYKHIVKDLKEAELVREHFLNKTKYGLFMSATLGNKDEYAKLMGMEESEYAQLFLPSTFDFSQSPIYICNSTYLNYSNFENNIDKVLMDAIKICNQHPNEKGVIHTATFKITNLLKQRIQATGIPDLINRFIFYSNTKEKEEMMELFKNSIGHSYIFVGPSLYEGIDLPDDKCRFQILIKVPYAQMTGYIKKKTERYPFWYKRNCIEKIVQAIGRSNRHPNDWSKVYLLDSCFDKIIYDCGETITNRLEYHKIY